MDVQRWVTDSGDIIQKYGLSGVKSAIREPWYKLLRAHGGSKSSGINLFDEDWDLAIILDACRYDLLAEVQPEYDFLTAIESKRSVASITPHWMDRTFVDYVSSELSDTVYVSGNPYSEDHAPDLLFDSVHEPWSYAWSENKGTQPPRPITDQAISVSREQSPDRLLVHYMQPHYPFIGGERIGEGIELDRFGHDGMDVWTKLELGLVSESEVWEAYTDNLRCALDDVGLLLENVDADSVVISSDHGNALGEWGVYGHPGNIAINPLRTVPWVETSATDQRTHEPGEYESRGDQGINRGDQLEALGYK